MDLENKPLSEDMNLEEKKELYQYFRKLNCKINERNKIRKGNGIGWYINWTKNRFRGRKNNITVRNLQIKEYRESNLEKPSRYPDREKDEHCTFKFNLTCWKNTTMNMKQKFLLNEVLINNRMKTEYNAINGKIFFSRIV